MISLPLSYHWRNLFIRKMTTLLTVLVILAVVATLTWIVGFKFSLDRSLAVASDPRVMIVLRRGTDSETNSALAPEEFNRLTQVSGIATDPASGAPLISPELYWQVQLPRVRDQGRTRANVALRGVTPAAFAVHRNVRLLGPMFSTGEPQVIVGQAAAKQFSGLNVGDKLQLGFGENREFTVVGHFSADGGPLESEVWMYLTAMQSAYQRPGYSSAAIRLAEGVPSKTVVDQLKSPTIQLAGFTEGEYWRKQASLVQDYQRVAFVLVAMMAIAAIFAVANTMYATVAGRTREIAMLRTIGYKPRHILLGFVLEAVMLAVIGGVLGCLACWAYLQFAGNTKDVFGGSSFTTLAYEIRLDAWQFLPPLLAVVLIGALGAFLPAWRAARTQVITALREA